MASIPVDLPKPVTGEALEQACIKAAEEIGYRAKPKDEFSVRFSLGSIQRHRDYDGTYVAIRNRLFIPVLKVRGIIKGQQQNDLYVWNGVTGLLGGIASEQEVQDYLENVSKYL